MIKDRFQIDEVIRSFSSIFHNISSNKKFIFCFFFIFLIEFLVQVEEWLNMCDTDGNGEVSYEEFKFSLMGNMMVEL